MAGNEWRTRLAEELARKGVKVTELSVQLGKHRDYVSRIINGSAQPNAELLMALLDKAGLSFADVMEPKTSDQAKPPKVETTPLRGSLERIQDILNTDTFTRGSNLDGEDD